MRHRPGERSGSVALEHHVVRWITTESHRSRRNHDARIGDERGHAADERLPLLRVTLPAGRNRSGTARYSARRYGET